MFSKVSTKVTTQAIDFTSKEDDPSFFCQFPVEIVLMILKNLPVSQLCRVMTLSKKAYQILHTDVFWKVLYLNHFGPRSEDPSCWKTAFKSEYSWSRPPTLHHKGGQGVLFVNGTPVIMRKSFSKQKEIWELSISSSIYKKSKSLFFKFGVREAYIEAESKKIIVTDEGCQLIGFNSKFKRIFKIKQQAPCVAVIFLKNTILSASKHTLYYWQLKKNSFRKYNIELVAEKKTEELIPSSFTQLNLDIVGLHLSDDRLLIRYSKDVTQIVSFPEFNHIYMQQYEVGIPFKYFTKNKFYTVNKEKNTINVYSIRDGQLVDKFENLEEISGFSLDAYSQRLLVLQNRTNLKLFDLSNKNIIYDYPSFIPESEIQQAWVRNNYAMVLEKNQTFSLWNLSSYTEIYQMKNNDDDDLITRVLFGKPHFYIAIKKQNKFSFLSFTRDEERDEEFEKLAFENT